MHTPNKAHLRFLFYILLPWFPFAIYYLWIYESPYTPPETAIIERKIDLRKLKLLSLSDSLHYIEHMGTYPNYKTCTGAKYATIYECVFNSYECVFNSDETVYIFELCKPYKNTYIKTIEAIGDAMNADVEQFDVESIQVFLPEYKDIPDGSKYILGNIQQFPK